MPPTGRFSANDEEGYTYYYHYNKYNLFIDEEHKLACICPVNQIAYIIGNPVHHNFYWLEKALASVSTWILPCSPPPCWYSSWNRITYLKRN